MNETERDRRVDAAWSAASREAPPPSLDAAIRGAARRAVDAGPRPKRDKHWWYPLAAAATVAVLAVGIIQLTPEQVAPTIVADMAVAPREANKDVARPVAPADMKVVEPSAAITAASPPRATPSPPAQASARRAQMAASGSLAGERAELAATEKDTPKPPPAAKRELAAQDKLASTKSDAAAANTVASPSAAVPANVAPPRSEPFPAAAPEPQREAYAEERKPAPNTPAKAAAPQVARSAAAPSEEAQMRSRVAMAKVAPTDEAKAKQAADRSVEEWIKRIRDLKNEGRLDEAAKELVAFRTAYGERADALLPADLRAMKAQPAK
jgi:hypothetical protein